MTEQERKPRGVDGTGVFLWGEFENVWCSDYYDGPLCGICRHNGRLCVYRLSGDSDEVDADWAYRIERLSLIQGIRWKMRQWIFERMVGYHWSGKMDRRFTKRLDSLSCRLYYWRNTLRNLWRRKR